jgi:hypothetical protein
LYALVISCDVCGKTQDIIQETRDDLGFPKGWCAMQDTTLGKVKHCCSRDCILSLLDERKD